MKRKICIPVLSRANFGRLKSVLHAVNNHEDLELQLIIGGSVMLPRFGIYEAIKTEGFDIKAEVMCTVSGDKAENMATTTGLLTIQLTQVFKSLKPDIVLVHADRYEMLAIATAASYMSIPLAHTQGGETSGNIDDKVRSAISMLSDIHFPATIQAESNLAFMGARGYIKTVGCPSIDLLVNLDKCNTFAPGYIMVCLHPVTTESEEDNYRLAEKVLKATTSFELPVVWVHSNIDPMNSVINHKLKELAKSIGGVTFIDSTSPESFYNLMRCAECLVGNTSSGIREGNYLGTPYVCVGDRQREREYYDNTIYCHEDKIRNGIRDMIGKRFTYSGKYGDGTAGKKIAKVLAEIEVKRCVY